MQPPGGGPEDKEPPEVLWTVPVKDSVRVGRKVNIQIAFSEKMNHESVEKAVYLSPFPPGEIGYGWKKNVLTIRLDDSLEKEKTFVVTVGTDAKDNHANSLPQAFSFAFSTGDSIDRGSISGRVIAENTKGVSIWSYRLDGVKNPDSLIYRNRADYITQAGAGGLYQLSYLSPGKYRVYAVADLDADYRYTPSSDFIGLTYKDVTLRGSRLEAGEMDFMMFQEDTAAFRMESVTPIDERLLTAGFSKPLRAAAYFENDTDRVSLLDRFELTDSITGGVIGIKEAYLNPANLREVAFLTENRFPGVRYQLVCRAIAAQNGDSLRYDRLTFEGRADSNRLSLTMDLLRPAVKDGYILPDEYPQFRFSTGLVRSTFEENFRMEDSTGREIRGSFVWTNSAQVEFKPRSWPASLMDYRITIATDSIRTWQELPGGDTVAFYKLRSFKLDSLGLVSGTIIDIDEINRGPYYITCRNVNRSLRDHTVRVNDVGSFTFNFLIPGKYTMVAYRDDDRNGVYSYGRVSPMEFPEKFTSYTDTVTVRPNWETSNITIRFRKP